MEPKCWWNRPNGKCVIAGATKIALAGTLGGSASAGATGYVAGGVTGAVVAGVRPLGAGAPVGAAAAGATAGGSGRPRLWSNQRIHRGGTRREHDRRHDYGHRRRDVDRR